MAKKIIITVGAQLCTALSGVDKLMQHGVAHNKIQGDE